MRTLLFRSMGLRTFYRRRHIAKRWTVHYDNFRSMELVGSDAVHVHALKSEPKTQLRTAPLENVDMIRYHYTSLATALKILTDHPPKEQLQLHLTNLRYMNDGAEFIYGVKLFRHIFETKYNGNPQSVFAGIEDAPCQYFVCCFSHHHDSFAQWMLYGDQGHGVCLGIDMGICTQGTNEVKAHEVIYDRQDQEALLTRHADDMKSKSFSDELLRDIARFKHSGFVSEAETRLIYAQPFLNTPPPNLHYRASQGKLVPYIAFRFSRDAIVSIKLGPRAKYVLNEFYLSELCLRQQIAAVVSCSELSA